MDIRHLDLDRMTINELRKECAARELSGKGKKTELKAKLERLKKRAEDAARLEVMSCPEAVLCRLLAPEAHQLAPVPGLQSEAGNRRGDSEAQSTAEGTGAKEGKTNSTAQERLAEPACSRRALRLLRGRFAAMQRRRAGEQETVISKQQAPPRRSPYRKRPSWHTLWPWVPLLVIVALCVALALLMSPRAGQRLLQACDWTLSLVSSAIEHYLRQGIGVMFGATCGVDAVLSSYSVRAFVPREWHTSLEDAAELAATTGRAKGMGILLVCDDNDTCSKGIEAMRNASTAAGRECWNCFESIQALAIAEGENLAGELQLQLTALLKGCPTAVFAVEEASHLPHSAAKVLVNALSEHGHFQDGGMAVPSNRATYIFTISGDVLDASMTLEKFEKRAKEQLYASWTSKQSSRAGRNVHKETAWALRRMVSLRMIVHSIAHSGS